MSVTQRKLVKSESQPILIPAGDQSGNKIFFPDNQYIRNKKLMALNLCTDLNEFLLSAAGVVAPQKYVDGKVILQLVQAGFIYLTLESYSGVQFVRRRPILNFSPYFKSGVSAGQGGFGVMTNEEFIGQRVNWPKSYIEFAPGTPAFSVETYCLFDIDFTEPSRGKKSAEQILQLQLGTEFMKKS